MSDPSGTMRSMADLIITATNFRKHIARISHSVAHRQDRYIVTWHRQKHVVVVSYEDYLLLRKLRRHRVGPVPATSEKTAKALPLEPSRKQAAEPLADPFEMPIEDVKRHNEAFKKLPLHLQPWGWIARAARRLAMHLRRTRETGPPS